LEKLKDYRCRVYLGCSASVMTSGVRDTIRYLVENKKIHLLVLTADGLEADIL